MADFSVLKPDTFILSKHVVVFLVVGCIGFASALFLITVPQNLTDIGGYGPVLKGTPSLDLKAVLNNAVEGGYSVTLTETAINHWLGRTLVAKQGGWLASQVSLDRVWVRLESGCAEVVMARKILGRPFTVSMFVKIDQVDGPKGPVTEVQLHGGPYFTGDLPLPPRGGRFGKLVVPQGFLLLVMPAYQKLAALYRDEIHLGFEEMARVKIEQGRLVLNPREPSDDPGDVPPGLPKTY